jgi:hypothetical protein
MNDRAKWMRVMYFAGVVCLLVGTLDPMDGSVLIAAGSGLLALSTHLTHDRHRRIFLVSFVLIATGVIFLFYLSSLGGFGGNSGLSWWWGLLILPYPVGWLLLVILLINRLIAREGL